MTKRLLRGGILCVVAAAKVEESAHVLNTVQLRVYRQTPAVQGASPNHQGLSTFHLKTRNKLIRKH